jgi:hypothetical protein
MRLLLQNAAAATAAKSLLISRVNEFLYRKPEAYIGLASRVGPNRNKPFSTQNPECCGLLFYNV